jgi:ADP-heptose:LPS heptosyltransferase
MIHRLRDQLLQLLMRRWARKRPSRPFDLSAMEGVKRILLMTTTAIGDTLFSTPAIRAVKETYPEKEVHVLCHRRHALLLQENPWIDRLFFYRGKSKGLRSLVRSLREQRYDLVIILHSNDPEAVPLAWATRAPYLIGSETGRFAAFLSRGVVCREENRHAIECRLDLVRAAGADTADRRMDFFLPADWEPQSRRVLDDFFGGKVQPLIGLHPTGSGKYKWWPAEYFVDLGNRLFDRYGCRFILFSSRAEAPAAQAIASRLKAPVLATEGRFDLALTGGLIRSCRLFIANDSGPLHMALALRVPTLALIGADSPRRIGPYQTEKTVTLYRKEEVCDRPRCLNEKCGDNRCLQRIRPEEAFQVIGDHFRDFLSNRGRAATRLENPPRPPFF